MARPISDDFLRFGRHLRVKVRRAERRAFVTAPYACGVICNLEPLRQKESDASPVAEEKKPAEIPECCMLRVLRR